jgi:integrase
MVAAGLRGKTVNMHLSTIRRIFASAVAEEIILTNPVSVRAVSASDSRPRAPFTGAELSRLVSTAETDEWRGLVILGATTGLRGGDIRRLTSENVIEGHLVIRPSKTKGSTGTVLRIPLHPQAVEWLKDRQGPLFPTLAALDGSKVANGFKRQMRIAKVAATVELAPGVTATRSMHSLRHSFATMLANAGIPEDVRRKLTGHASKLVHSKYSHHSEALDAAIASLPKF